MIKKCSWMIAILALFPVPAAAEDNWWYAESDRFKVYSSGGSEAAQDIAIKLERLDDAMRLFTGVPALDQPVEDVAKVTLFQFGETRDIGKLAGQDGVAGFFIPRAGNSVAFVPLEAGRTSRRGGSLGTRNEWDLVDFNIDPEKVLFHEYAHYFMFQHAPAAYPSWYIEGLAELFGTVKISDTSFTVGEPPKHREGEISLIDVNTDYMFQSNAKIARVVRYPVYGHGWLISSYLSFHPDRKGQLAKYLSLLNSGVNPPDAAQQAFGDLKVLEKELNAYRKDRARGMEALFASAEKPGVELRKLSPDEAARMPYMIEANAGVTPSEAKVLLTNVRALAQQYPSSVPVRRTLLEALYDAGEFAEASTVADGLMGTEEELDAQLYKAAVAMEYAKKDSSWLTTARKHFLAANAIEPTEPNALAGYYLTYALSETEKAPENALIALEAAFEHAPFDSGIRMTLAHLLLTENRDKSALFVLAPVVYQPHGAKRLIALRELVEKLEAGDREPLIKELTPSLVPKAD